MAIAESFLPELEGELATTRRLIERLPESRLDWKPHPKSTSLGELATHIVEMPRWGLRFENESFQVGTAKTPPMTTVEQFLARFDENAAAGLAAIAAKSDEQMKEEFTVLRANGEVFFKLSRKSVVRRLLLNHLIHHRGQFTVYLRLCDVPLPPVYGPTADEAM
jgi:uncharacterized damage-inducible protein DinB